MRCYDNIHKVSRLRICPSLDALRLLERWCVFFIGDINGGWLRTPINHQKDVWKPIKNGNRVDTISERCFGREFSDVRFFGGFHSHGGVPHDYGWSWFHGKSLKIEWIIEMGVLTMMESSISTFGRFSQCFPSFVSNGVMNPPLMTIILHKSYPLSPHSSRIWITENCS